MKYSIVEHRCGKCWSYLHETDNFCRKCGTKRGEGEFNPEHNIMQVVYGSPPVDITFVVKVAD